MSAAILVWRSSQDQNAGIAWVPFIVKYIIPGMST